MRMSILSLGRNNNGISPRNRTHSLLSRQRASKRKKESSRSKDRNKTKEKKKKVPNQKIERRKKKKERFPINDRNKKKRSIQKGLRTKKYLNKPTKLSQANKKRKEATELEVLLSL